MFSNVILTFSAPRGGTFGGGAWTEIGGCTGAGEGPALNCCCVWPGWTDGGMTCAAATPTNAPQIAAAIVIDRKGRISQKPYGITGTPPRRTSTCLARR